MAEVFGLNLQIFLCGKDFPNMKSKLAEAIRMDFVSTVRQIGEVVVIMCYMTLVVQILIGNQ